MNQFVNLLFRYSGLVLVVYWIALFIGTHIPAPPDIYPRIPYLDKILHFAAYSGLAFLLASAFTMQQSMSPRRYVTIFLSLALYGVLDELIQAIPSVGRHADVLDWLADVGGVAFGLLSFAAAAHIARRIGLALSRNRPNDKRVNDSASAPDSDSC